MAYSELNKHSGASEEAVSLPQIDWKALVNEKLALFGSTLRWNRVDGPTEAMAPLRGVKLLYVDDSVPLLEGYLPSLTVATGGTAEALHYHGQSPREIADEIEARQPELLLLDYRLSDDFNGAMVARILRQQCPAAVIVGFTSESQYVTEFKRAGVPLTVKKDTSEFIPSVEEVAALYGNARSQRTV